MQKVIKIGLLGAGTVGSGVVKVLEMNRQQITERVGAELMIKKVLVRDCSKVRPFLANYQVTDKIEDILNDDEIEIVVELMGGLNPAKDYMLRAMEAGKNVVTANKDVVAQFGKEMFAKAEEKDVDFLFEASVGGGIPIIRPLLDCLTAEKIDEIPGILNGTTNYMLTKMDKEGRDYADVLKEAQEKGYAERNPEADVEGYDACRKIAILASLNYQKTVSWEDIHTEGISKITKEDFAYASAIGRNIKLLGFCREENGKKYAMVAPFMVAEGNPLYSVNDVFNGILVHGNMVDQVMFYGRGAGKLPTASAVVSDVIEAAKHPLEASKIVWDDEKLTLNDKNDLSFAYAVRVKGSFEGSGAQEIFGTVSEIKNAGVEGEFGFVTDVMPEGEFLAKLEKAQDVISFIRLK